MHTVVVITPQTLSASDVMGAARATEMRVLGRRLDIPAEEVAAERPDLVVVDLPETLRLGPVVEPLASNPGLAEVPMLAVVGPEGMSDAVGAGLADFALRPLRAGELAARIRRLLRRRVDEGLRIQLGALLVDAVGYEASVAGKRLDLTYQEFELLKFLVSNPGRAFRRDELLARVWGYDYYGGSRTVDIHVRRIRAKLGHPYAACIQTIRHVGYKWVNDDE